MHYGASFAHNHLKWLGHDPLVALQEYKSLGFSWIRLGAYWNEIEKKQGVYDFEELDSIIDTCAKYGFNIVLTIGMKAPRYPEYYIPNWVNFSKGRLGTIDLKDEELYRNVASFIEKTVDHYKNNLAIKVWQVENEPLDPSGSNWWRISSKFLEKEVTLVKKLDSQRKIMVTLWGNELTKRGTYKQAMKIADIIGIDMYLKHPIFFVFNFFNRYAGPLDSVETIKKIRSEIVSQKKEFWVSELQAEPWETDGALTKQKNPKSFSPSDFKKNITYGKSLHPSVLFFWGFEWWYHTKKMGDSRYWDELMRIIKEMNH